MIDLISPCWNIISAYIQESTFSVHCAEFDPDVIVSCQDPLKCQNYVVLNKWDQFYESSFFSQSTSSQFISLWF